VDLNRPPDGAPLYPGRRETSVCPTESFDGAALYAEGAMPTAGEIAERLDMYWRPYHDRLSALTRALAERHGRCILWDAHSILSHVPGLFAGRLPDLNVGTAGGGSCTPALLNRIVATLARSGNFPMSSMADSKAAISRAITAIPSSTSTRCSWKSRNPPILRKCAHRCSMLRVRSR
jgi:N-formylglutamate deformylase